MEVTLNRKKWHSKLYNWTYGNRPNFWSLCPYFWMVILSIAIIPLTIVYKTLKGLYDLMFVPALINLIRKQERSNTTTSDKFDSTSKRLFNLAGKILRFLGKAFITLYLSCIGIALVFVILGNIIVDGWFDFFMNCLIMLGATILLSLIIWGILSYQKSEIKDSINGMIYSIKNKVCPKINWVDEEDENL